MDRESSGTYKFFTSKIFCGFLIIVLFFVLGLAYFIAVILILDIFFGDIEVFGHGGKGKGYVIALNCIYPIVVGIGLFKKIKEKRMF